MPRKNHLISLVILLVLLVPAANSEAKLAKKKLDYYANIALTSSSAGRGLDEVFPVIIRKMTPKNEKELKQLKAFDYFDGETYFWKKRGNVHHLYMRKPGERSKKLEVFVARIPAQSMMKTQMQLMKADPVKYQKYNLSKDLEILAVMGVSSVGSKQTVEFVEGKKFEPISGDVSDVVVRNADAMLLRFARKYGMSGVDLTLSETEEQSLGGYDKMMQVFSEEKILHKIFRDAKYTDMYKKIGGISIPGDFQVRITYHPYRPKGDSRYGSPKAMFYPVPLEKDGQKYYPLYVFPGAFINQPILESVVERELYHAQWWNAVANLPADLDKDWQQKSDQAYLREALLRTPLPYLEYDIFLKTKKTVTDTIGRDDAQVYFSYRTIMYQSIRLLMQDDDHIYYDPILPWTVTAQAIMPYVLTRKQQIQENWEENWELFGKFMGRDVQNLFDDGDISYARALLPADIQKALMQKEYKKEQKQQAGEAPTGIFNQLFFGRKDAQLKYQQRTVAKYMGKAFAQGYEKKRENRSMRFQLCLYSLDRDLHEKLPTAGMPQTEGNDWASGEGSIIRKTAENGYSYDDVYWLWDLFNREGSNVQGMFTALRDGELYNNLKMIVDDAEAEKQGISARQEAARELFEERIKKQIAARLLEEAGRTIYRNAAAKATRLAEEHLRRKQAVEVIEKIRKRTLIRRQWQDVTAELRVEDLEKRQAFRSLFDGLKEKMQADTAEEQWQATRDVIDSLQAAFELPLSEWLPDDIDADAYLESVMPADGQLNFDELDKFTIDSQAIEHLIYQEYLQEQGAAKEGIYEFARELKSNYEKRRSQLESQEAKSAGEALIGKLENVLRQQKKLAEETEEVKDQVALLDRELEVLGNPEQSYLAPVALPDNLPAGVPEPISDFSGVISQLSASASDDVSLFAAAYSYGKMLEDLDRELAQLLDAKRAKKGKYFAENEEVFEEIEGYRQAIDKQQKYTEQVTEREAVIQRAEEKFMSLMEPLRNKQNRPYAGASAEEKYQKYIQERWANKGFFAFSRKKKIRTWEPFVNSVNISLETDEQKVRELCNETPALHDYAGRRTVGECKAAARQWKEDFKESSEAAAELYHVYEDIKNAVNTDVLIAKCKKGQPVFDANENELLADGVCAPIEVEEKEGLAGLEAFYKTIQGATTVEYIEDQCDNLSADLKDQVKDICGPSLNDAKFKQPLVARANEMLALTEKVPDDADKESQKSRLFDLCNQTKTYLFTERKRLEPSAEVFEKAQSRFEYGACQLSSKQRVERAKVRTHLLTGGTFSKGWLQEPKNATPVIALQQTAKGWLDRNQGDLKQWLEKNTVNAEKWLDKEANKLLPKISERMAIEDARFNLDWQKVVFGVGEKGVEHGRELEKEAASAKKFIEGHKSIVDSYRKLGADEQEIEAAIRRAAVTRVNFSHFYAEKFSRRDSLIKQKIVEKNRLGERLARNRFLEQSFDGFADAWLNMISNLSPEARAELDNIFKNGPITNLIAKVKEAVDDKWCEGNVRRKIYAKGTGWEKNAKKSANKIDDQVGTELGELFGTPIYKIIKSCGAALDYTLCCRADLMGGGNRVEWDIDKYDSLADAQKQEMRKKWFKCVFKVGIHVADVTGFTGFILDQAGTVIHTVSMATSGATGIDTSRAADAAKDKLTEKVEGLSD